MSGNAWSYLGSARNLSRFLAGFGLILLLFAPVGSFAKHYGPLMTARPIGFLYYLAGIAIIGTLTFEAQHAWSQHLLERAKGGA